MHKQRNHWFVSSYPCRSLCIELACSRVCIGLFSIDWDWLQRPLAILERKKWQMMSGCLLTDKILNKSQLNSTTALTNTLSLQVFQFPLIYKTDGMTSGLLDTAILKRVNENHPTATHHNLSNKRLSQVFQRNFGIFISDFQLPFRNTTPLPDPDTLSGTQLHLHTTKHLLK